MSARPAMPLPEATRRAIRHTRRGDQKSEQIRATATALFLRHGYDGVSVDEIVRIVGGSKTNIYHHFGGKEGLFIAIVKGLCEELLAAFVVADVSNLGLDKGLRSLAAALLGILLQEQHLALYRLVIAESGRFPALGRVWFESGPTTSRRIIARFIVQQQRAGRLRRGDPHELATLFHDMISLDLVQRAVVGDRPTEDEIRRTIDAAVKIFLRGCARIEARAPAPRGTARA